MQDPQNFYESTILIVDDNPANLQLLYEALSRGGYKQIIPAQGAESALQRLKYNTPDLVLLDVMMPDVDGFELYEMLRAQRPTAETPVIFISALADKQAIEKGFSLGAVDYITKPFRSSEVLGRVSTHLRLKAYSDELNLMLARNRCLLDSAGEGIMGVDANFHVTYINPFAQNMLGYAAGELENQDVHNVLFQGQAPVESAGHGESVILNIVNNGGISYVEDDRFYRRDGSPVMVEYTVSSLHRKFKSRESIIVFRDITERRLMEQALKESAVVFEVSNDGVLITDLDGTIRRVNPAFIEITGYSREEVIGQNPRLFKSGRHEADFYNYMWSTLLSEGYFEAEVWNRRKDGSVYPIWQRITVIRDNRGQAAGYVSQFSDITRRKLTEKEIRYRGNYDALTGLANRVLLCERLEHEIKVHKRKQLKFSLLYIDLDKFKHVNDTQGHSKGDILLQQAANRIQGVIREIDTASRYGGDEFVIMLPEQENLGDSERVCTRLLETLAEPFDLEGYKAMISASIGVAVYPNDGIDAEALFRNADFAMYKAKDKGRNQVQFFTESMEQEYLEKVQLEVDLRQALSKNELSIHYQPIVDLNTRKIAGVEALIRWQHPQRGLVSPAVFVPIAEESTLIREIGLWVLQAVCNQLSEWHRQGLDIYASVNVSTNQIPLGLSLQTIKQLLDDCGLSPGKLVLEITESVFATDMQSVTDWLSEVRKLGIRVYLDDFGTGYSSLSYLKKFPVDSVKIDRVFIRDINKDSSDMAMVHAVLLMSKALNLDVIAEGVETPDQLDILNELKCPLSQGYLFSKPVSAENLPDVIENFAY